MNLRLDTLILYVQDLDRLTGFYTCTLGLKLLETDAADWALLQAGEACIGLHRAGAAYRHVPGAGGAGHSNAKVVFAIGTDLAHMRQHLLDLGVPMGPVKTFEGYGFLLCDGQDPEGNMFQLKRAKS